MKLDVHVKNGIIIPEHELEITTSRSSGAGGQHVNKTETKVTVRWNVKNSAVLTEEQKERVMQNLHAQLTAEGDLIVSNSTSRSQQQNKMLALNQLGAIVRKALHVSKKRTATKISKGVKESRQRAKQQRSKIKKMRGKKFDAD